MSYPIKYRYVLMVLVHVGAFSPMIVISQESPHGPITQQCSDCHSTQGWKTLAHLIKFDHNTTSFYLVGQHKNTSCKSCHTNLRFQGTPRTCVSCHKKDYDAAIIINHREGGLSTECAQCHDPSANSWQTSFDHNNTQFPIRGAHEAVPCEQCHLRNVYKGTPIECITCHRTEYVTANNPNHQTAGFSTDCAVCHRAVTWQPAALFPHTAFPIGPGANHRPGVWSSCVDCHMSGTNYSSFECIFCHQHEESRTDSRHREVRNYIYQSSACYRCHPTGGGGG